MTIFLIMIAYILGIIWGLYIKNIAPILLIIAIVLIIKRINKLNRYYKIFFPKKKLILILILFVIGFSYISILEYSFNNKFKNIQNDIIIEAFVISNCKEKEYKDVYTIEIESINKDKSYKGTCLILSVKNNKNKIEYGDKITFVGEYEEPNTQRNYGGFDYEQYLKTQKIYGLITTNKIEKIEKSKYNKILIKVNDLRNKIYEKANILLEEDEAGILSGILIGNKENISQDLITNFKNSNLSHILAVSGAHVSYIILGITFIFTKSKMSKKISKILTIIILIFFIILTGQTASVARACIMAIYIIIGSLIYKKPNILASISISTLIILIINPYKILDIGMQLSYGGTIGIILFNKILLEKIKQPNTNIELLNKLIKSIKEILIVTVSANLIIFPIMAYHYNTISLTFFISNILAGPILGTIIILGFITIFISFISVGFAKITSIILSLFLKLLILIANFSSVLPLSKIYVKTPSIISIIIYYVILLLFIYIWKMKKRPKRRFEKTIIIKIKKSKRKIISIILILSILFQIIKIIPSDLGIYFIDVGQGDSTLIVTPNHKTILIDGGGNLNNEVYDVGKNTVIPYLLDRGISKLDYIIVSHFDSDHVRTEF